VAPNHGDDQLPLLVVINVMYEMWAPGTAPGIGPMGNPLPGGALDYQARSWSDYGARTGIDRLLTLLDEAGIQGSIYASGILGELHPDSIAAIVAGGHELCGHAWSQDVLFPHLSEEAERDDIARSTAALAVAGGVRPSGWMSPRCTPSAHTASLLAAAGYRWWGDVFDAELPYRIETSAGPITALPFGLDVNDLPMFVRYGAPARELHERFSYLLGALRSEGQPAYLDVTVHAHLAARPSGARALREILDEVNAARDCAFATRGEVVERFVDEGLRPDRG
jgi:peptidoglycan/xylan/chitin deacetylase (PgdA/CDA1 family)